MLRLSAVFLAAVIESLRRAGFVSAAVGASLPMHLLAVLALLRELLLLGNRLAMLLPLLGKLLLLRIGLAMVGELLRGVRLESRALVNLGLPSEGLLVLGRGRETASAGRSGRGLPELRRLVLAAAAPPTPLLFRVLRRVLHRLRVLCEGRAGDRQQGGDGGDRHKGSKTGAAG
ncbi:MAG TPA: hypothetical protein VGK20_10215 [Candidatus Binatia bacterium]